MSFKIGDRVVVVHSRIPDYFGRVTTIVSDLLLSLGGDIQAGILVHVVDLPTLRAGYSVVYPPEGLELYLPDDRERSEWTPELRALCSCRKAPA